MSKQKTTKDLMNGILVAMTVIIFVVIASLIVATITSNSVFDDIATTGTITNETLTALNETANQTLSIISTDATSVCTLTSLVNASDATTVPATNYTFTGSECKIILLAGSDYIGEDVNITYGYSYASGTSLAGINVTEITSSFGSFVTNLIAFLAVIGTIVGVVWLVMYVRKLFDKKSGLQDITA